MIPAFERAKTVHALDRTATVISNLSRNKPKTVKITHINLKAVYTTHPTHVYRKLKMFLLDRQGQENY
jgi:phosphoenolpyruvate carboxylase